MSAGELTRVRPVTDGIGKPNLKTNLNVLLSALSTRWQLVTFYRFPRGMPLDVALRARFASPSPAELMGCGGSLEKLGLSVRRRIC
jgi:hypothetical protein